MHRLRLATLACSTLFLSLPAGAADLLAANGWPMAGVQSAFAEQIGIGQIHDITIGADRISITADHPTDPSQTMSYYWDQTEVRRSSSFVNFSALGMGDTAPFPLEQLQFDRLPEIKTAALAAYGEPDAQILEIEASQPTNRTSKKLLPLWEVHIGRPGEEEGVVWVTALGQVVDVVLPDSQQVAFGPWLAPETVENTLQRLGEEFGTDTKFLEIMIDDQKALIKMEDPQSPGSIAEFYMDAQKITRSISSGMMPDPFAPPIERAFTLADIAALDAETLGELEQRTLARLERDDMTVFRYTISRTILFMTPEDDTLLVEVRAEAPDQWTGGRVAYDMAGEEVDVVLP